MIKQYLAYLRKRRWAVILAYVLILLVIFTRVDAASHSVSDTLIGVFLPFVILTFILIVVCYKTGEKPRWQWGLCKEDEK